MASEVNVEAYLESSSVTSPKAMDHRERECPSQEEAIETFLDTEAQFDNNNGSFSVLVQQTPGLSQPQHTSSDNRRVAPNAFASEVENSEADTVTTVSSHTESSSSLSTTIQENVELNASLSLSEPDNAEDNSIKLQKKKTMRSSSSRQPSYSFDEEQDSYDDDFEIAHITYEEKEVGDNDEPKNIFSRKMRSCLSSYANKINFISHFVGKSILRPLAKVAVTNSLACIILVICISIVIPAIAFYSGSLILVTSNDEIWTPFNSPVRVRKPIIYESLGFPKPPNVFSFIVHQNGENLLSYNGIRKAFDVVETIQSSELYKSSCPFQNDTSVSASQKCFILSVTGFWGNDANRFEEYVSSIPDSDLNASLAEKISASSFPNGFPIERDIIISTNSNVSKVDDLHESVAFMGTFLYPKVSSTGIQDKISKQDQRDMEHDVVGQVNALNEIWAFAGNNNEHVEGAAVERISGFHVDVGSEVQTEADIAKSIVGDIPVVMSSFVVMFLFTSIVFTKFRKNSSGNRFVSSSGILGGGAVTTILMSILTGYGICILCHVPVTSITQVLPFVLFGIGLDDSFILADAFERTDELATTIDRILHAVEEVGMSITVTTLTNIACFAVGAFSHVPAVRWFCIYACVTIFVDFLYQITFFLAILAVNQQRINANRYDFFFCFKARCKTLISSESNFPKKIREKRKCNKSSVALHLSTSSLRSKVMDAYINILFRPIVKVIVLLAFMALLVVGSIYASHAEVHLDMRMLTPKDTITDDYFQSDKRYRTSAGSASLNSNNMIYFTDIDVTVPNNQDAMFNFVNDMVEKNDYIALEPKYFWLSDFLKFTEWQSNGNDEEDLSFNDYLTQFLEIDIFHILHADNIIRDPTNGNVIASRVPFLYALDTNSMSEQIYAYKQQDEIAKEQTLNHDKRNNPNTMFSHGSFYGIWSHFEHLRYDLIINVLLVLAVVCFVSFLTLPHPGGTLLAVACTAMVNAELVGILAISGFGINSITIIFVMMGIGFVIDYCMHVIHAYLHAPDMVDGVRASREDRARYALSNIGVSVILGGVSTFLGVSVLMFTSSNLFWILFVLLSSIVVLGLGHGVIFIPVVLSLIGPDNLQKHEHVKLQNIQQKAKSVML